MVTNMVELQVKIKSSETVKPSIPTPSHLRIFNLSFIDQLSAPLHIPALLFYNPTPQTQPLDITNLKTSLSETLSHFYPLAGRCKDDSTLICNDEGIPFIEANVNCSLSYFLSLPNKIELLGKFQFLPSKEYLANGKKHISELVHLALQVNVFTCGGVVIGCYMLHKLLDGVSLGLFFERWSTLARKGCVELIKPDFDSTVAAFPTYHGKQKEEVKEQETKFYIPNGDSLKIIGKGFVFSDVALTKLKVKAASKQNSNPTRFESVLGFMWEQALIAESSVSEHSELPVLIFAADIRKRMGSPLSESSIGNISANPMAFAKKGLNLPELAGEIRAAILKLNDETVKQFQGEGKAEALFDHRRELGGYLAKFNPSAYIVSSWCRNGVCEADFGFDKPRWIMFPVSDGEVIPACRNFITLTDYHDQDGDGIVAWIYLEEKEMEVLESNQEFLSFASLW